MHTERMFSMKKLLSVLLVLAMVVSCIAVVQMTTLAASEETLVNTDFEDSNVKIDVFQCEANTDVTYVNDGAPHNGVIKFAPALNWRTPMWNLGSKLKAIADKNPGKVITVNISLDLKAVKDGSTIRAIIRNKAEQTTHWLTSVLTVNTSWKTVSGSFDFIAANFTDENDYNFMFDYLTNNTDGFFMDNLKIVAGIGTRETVNGNAENGTMGWDTFREVSGSAIEQVEGGANGTAHAIKFSVGNGNKWASIAFNIGPAIIKDEANAYYGGGADTYKLTFWAKAAQGKGGKFNVLLNSQFHRQDKDSVKKSLTDEQYKEIEDIASGTYIICSAITMTDEWQKFEVEIPVSENYLKLMSKLYSFGKTDAYELILRLDGTLEGGAFTGSTFDYYVDEVTIVSASAATPTPGEDAAPTPTPKRATGVKVTFNDDVTFADPTEMFFNTDTNGGVTSAADIKNNQITKTFKIKNHGEETIGVVVRLQATVKKSDGVTDTWAGNPDTNDIVEIEPGKVGTVTITVPVKDGKVTILEHEVPVEKLFARFDVTGEGGVCELPKGTSFTIFCDEQVADALTKSWISNSDKITRELSYESLDSNSSSNGDLLPVAFIAVAVVATAALVVVSRKRKFNA